MARIPHDITPAELAVLRSLWKRGPSTIRQLTDRLYPEGTHAHYTTVQSLLDRLTSKRLVEREKQGRINVFSAAATRGELITRQLRATADRLCDGSLAPLLSHLVRQVELTEGELKALEALVERLDEEGRSGEKVED